jgi:hypothetical protein
MDREKTLALIDVARARGLEIGALTKPVVTRDMGPVEYIDRATTEELRAWYVPNDQVNIDEIVQVDHVWGAQTLLECVGGRRVYDYVVASHVIEHVPDLFGWLGEIGSVLADGGIASFIVPDKRHTFDILRRTSSDAEMVDAYVRGLRRPDTRQIFDHFMGFRDVGARDAAGGHVAPADLPAQHDAAPLMDFCRRTAEAGDYIDTHCWVFTPHTFLDAMDLGSRLGVLPFELAAFFPTPAGSNEFFVSLRRLPDGLTPDAARGAFMASRDRLAIAPDPYQTLTAEDLMHRARVAETQLAALHQSSSWRLTAPLRGLMTLARRLRA